VSCDRYRDWIGERRTGILPEERGRELDAHLASCAACRTVSARLGRLVALLEVFPAPASLPGPSRRRRWWPAVAAAALAALAVPAIGGLPERPTLEGAFEEVDGAYVARDANASVVLAGHRLRCAKGTRLRLSGRNDCLLEAGRLDVASIRAGATGLGVDTPLGRIDVIGTEFIVEVTPVNKAAAGTSFLVGLLVSSGAVSYAEREHRLRLEAGQGVVAESGKPPRKVVAAELEHRRRASFDQARGLERALAALELERDRLKRELEAGAAPAPKPPLTPSERRDRLRRVARFFATDLLGVSRSAPEEGPPPDSFTETIDSTVMADALSAATEAGVSLFEPRTLLARPEFIEELILAVGKGNAALTPAGVEVVVRGARAGLEGPWETTLEERRDQARTLERALRDVDPLLPQKDREELQRAASGLIGVPGFVVLGDAPSREQWTSRLLDTLQLDAGQRALAQPVVATWFERRSAEAAPAEGRHLSWLVRQREHAADLARELHRFFPDRKDRLELAIESH
jgi:hypothetical protein